MPRLNRPRARSVGLTILTLMAWAGCAPRGTAGRVPPPPTVVVVRAEVMDVPTVVTTNATTRAIDEVTIRARVKGFLEEPKFKEGADVKKGQLLFVVDELPFRAQVAQARAKLSEAESALTKARQSRGREVASATVELSDAARLLAKVEETRTATLFKRNAAAKGDVDQADANLKRAEAQVAADRAAQDQAKSDFDVNILAAQASVDLARAVLDEAEINLGYCRMVAPIDGRIGEALVKGGNLVGTGTAGDTALATIQQLDPMGVDLQVASRYLPNATRLVRQGITMSLNVGGERVHPYPATSTFIDNRVDPATSTFLMKATTPNPARDLLPGDYVSATIVVGEHPKAVVVPEQAVIVTQNRPKVYVVGPDKKVAEAAVTIPATFPTYRGMMVIESGLAAGQLVVCEGIQLIRPGLDVKVEEVKFEAQVRSPGPDSPASTPPTSQAPPPAPAEPTPAKATSPTTDTQK